MKVCPFLPSSFILLVQRERESASERERESASERERERARERASERARERETDRARERERESESERENETYAMKLRALSTSASSLNTGMKGIFIRKD